MDILVEASMGSPTVETFEDNYREELNGMQIDNVENDCCDDGHEENNANSNNEDNVESDMFKVDEGFNMENVDFINTTEADMKLYHFGSRDVAFDFYDMYAKKKGFAARRWNVVKNKNGEVSHQTFVCFKQGYRLDKYLKRKNRKRVPRALTRCGCNALLRVRYIQETGRWHVKEFIDNHNHDLLSEKFFGMLSTHRKLHECDLLQLNNMREAGIGVTQIYGLAANQTGGYDRMGFRKKDMYNEIEKHKRMLMSDVRSAFSYLRELRSCDPKMFWRRTVDSEGRLQNLFWTDGASRAEYNVFGDVVAFDATYRRNKYMYPLVVFARVNHHNQTIVFGSGLVANETEETYVWLLKQFVEAMKGKLPSSVITDGDLAMRNAIRQVFPSAHHRLCAWHLLRNATSNINNARFTSKFGRCMLGDYDVARFRTKWDEMINEFQLHGNQWIKEVYEKRKIWATAHIRGNFFAGFRTTSRCEGMHAQVGRFVHYRNNLTEFLKQFSRYLAYIRQREVEADFESIIGEPVLQTSMEDIERSAAKLYTRKLFLLFRPVLERACGVKVVTYEQTLNGIDICYE